VSSEITKALLDNRTFCSTFILIDDRNGNIIPFEYNLAQQMMDAAKTGRDLVVKAGQLGSTTYWLAQGFKKVITEENTTAVVVAHEEFLTQRLLNTIQVIYDRMPIPDRLKPKMAHSSTYEKSFPTLNSVFYIGTAGAKVFGRGEPINFFLGSEVAFWPDPYKILYPTMDRVPLEGHMIIESTPNGEGTPRNPNAFYDLVQEALTDSDSVWNLVALPWWMESEYQIEEGSKYALLSDRGDIRFTTEEIGIIIKAGWSDDEAPGVPI